MKAARKNVLLKGTLILTLAGIAVRILGFFYKIFLSQSMGAEKLGIYQLIFPIYGICFTIYASGIQTSISKLIAEEQAKKNSPSALRPSLKILRTGILLSLAIALVLSVLTWHYSDFLAERILMEPASATSLRILSFVFPFCGMTACINGYYYGRKLAGVPAITQLVEQLIRIACVVFFAFRTTDSISVSCELAVFGIVAGEIGSNIYDGITLIITSHKQKKQLGSVLPTPGRRSFLRPIAKLAVPLTLNRLILSILHSAEAVLIPVLLRRSGMDGAASLSVFGIANGMVLPFLLFPSAITSSLSLLLLPALSEAKAVSDDRHIRDTLSATVKYSILLSIIFTAIFIYFGESLGKNVFHNELAGEYLTVLAWLCPAIYLSTTLSSSISGLGKPYLTFINSLISSCVRIMLIILLIPNIGIYGYFISMLFGQFLLMLLDILALRRISPFPLHPVDALIKPVCAAAFSSILCYRIYIRLCDDNSDGIFSVLAFCMACVVIYSLILVLTGSVSRKDLKR